MKYAAHLLLQVVSFALAFSSMEASAQNFGNRVDVCNEGDVDLQFLHFSTNSSLLGGDKGKIAGWWTIKPGDCEDINPVGFDTVAVGFLQTSDKGIRGNPVYVLNHSTERGSTSWAPAIVCAPTNGIVNYKNSLGLVRSNYLPPCKPGFEEFRMSFGVIPNDQFPKYYLTPRGSDKLSAWPKKKAEPAPSLTFPTEHRLSKETIEANRNEALRRAAADYKKKRMNQISAACVDAKLYSVRSKAMCECLASNIVEQESWDVLNVIELKLNQGDELMAVLEEPASKKPLVYSGFCFDR